MFHLAENKRSPRQYNSAPIQYEMLVSQKSRFLATKYYLGHFQLFSTKESIASTGVVVTKEFTVARSIVRYLFLTEDLVFLFVCFGKYCPHFCFSQTPKLLAPDGTPF